MVLSNPCQIQLKTDILHEVNTLAQWFEINKLQLNLKKTTAIKFDISNKQFTENDYVIHINQQEIQTKTNMKFLGIHLDYKLNFSKHIHELSIILVSKGIFIIKTLSRFSNLQLKLNFYYSFVYSHLKYAIPVWGKENYKMKLLFKLQKRCIRQIFCIKKNKFM